MINKKLTLFLLVLTILSLTINKFNHKQINYLGISSDSENLSGHPETDFDQYAFDQSLIQIRDAKPASYSIRGGIVPHHLFPNLILTDFFYRLSLQKPKTLILLGPNHFEQGNFKALTSLYIWKTRFGDLEPNIPMINQLINNNLLKPNEAVLETDHSFIGLMPFIKYFMPEIKVVPILLSGFMSETDNRVLADNIKNQMDQKTVIIAAVDMSHYLTNLQAQEKDKVTLEIMQNYDFKQLKSLNNDYLDSPDSISVLLHTMQALNTTQMEILNQTNSGKLQHNDFIETTSYFSIFFH